MEFGLPAGNGLAKTIASRTFFWFDDSGRMERGDIDLYRAVQSRFGQQGGVLQAGRRLSEGLPLSLSIDDFLYNHGHDIALVTLGKAAIVQSILEAESRSTLTTFQVLEPGSPSRGLSVHADTWIQKLFSFLQTGVRRSEVHRIFENISIINFNYDRCVEMYFFHALQLAYGIESDEAASVLATLDITHPYGQVGKLPWQDLNNGIRFGETPRDFRILNIADEIKTFTEQSHSDDEKQHWRSCLSEAEQVVFLGFGFHKQNADLISLNGKLERCPSVYATSYGASSEDQDVFRSRIQKIFSAADADSARLGNEDISFAHAECNKMMSRFGMKLFS